MRLIFSLILLFLAFHASSQKYTISGYLTDEQSGEVLIGATIFATTTQTGTTTNNYGFYSLTLNEADSIGMVFSYLGYTAKLKKVFLRKNIELNVGLLPASVNLTEVVVTAKSDQNVSSAQMGVVDIPIAKLKELPAILGETDVLKIVQLLPGVQGGQEGTTGFYVRGGNADQNLVQLDEAAVYNPNHLFGLFSTFNSRALNNVTLIKGGFPAQFGGRLSSILDITMKEGNNQHFKTEGGLGLISSQLTLEGPFKKKEASFIVSGRRTYLDLLAKPFLPKGNESNYHFYDLNAKVNWKLSSKDRIFISGFKGQDKAVYQETQGINYTIDFGNSTATARWNHLFSPKLFSNTSFILNNYEQDIRTKLDNARSQVISAINDINVKSEFEYFPSPDHSILFGGVYSNHKFLSAGESGTLFSATSQLIDRNKIPKKFVNEWAIYVNDEWKINDLFSANIGLRMPGFFSKDTTYILLEPRASLKVSVSPTASIKGGFTMMNQFLHQIPSSTASIPNDIWIPSSNNTLPQKSQQVNLGYFQNFDKNNYEASVEFYYKTMDNQVLFREGNQLVEQIDVDEFLTYGKGWSYGAEFFVKKNNGRLTGWLSYTLSKTEQKFSELNFGDVFPFKFDRRHNLSAVASYKLTDRWSLSATFVYTSGSVYTLPISRINVANAASIFEGNYFIYEGRNNVRMAPYHRLDLSASYKKQRTIFGKKYESEWVFGFYNVYSRLNPYFVFFKIDPLTDQPVAKQVSLLPIIPSVNFNFKF